MSEAKQVRIGVTEAGEEARLGVLLEVSFSSTVLSPPVARAYAQMLIAAAFAVDHSEMARRIQPVTLVERP